jgi:hypothetical protein
MHSRLLATLGAVASVRTLLFASAGFAWAQAEDLDCTDFSSREGALQEFDSDASDPHNLDADNFAPGARHR